MQLVEQKILGITHAEVGAILLKKWRLPEGMIDVVLNHHTPQYAKPEYKQLTEYVYISNFIANNRGIDNGTGFFPEMFYDDIWDNLKISIDDIPQIIDEVSEELENAQQLLKLGGR